MTHTAHDLTGWHDLVRRRFVALDIRADDAAALYGRVTEYRVGPLAVAAVRSVGQTFRRTPGLIARHGEDMLQVGLVRSGEVLLEQDGRATPVPPGSFTLYDTTRPFTWTMSGEWRMDVFTWPREAVPLDVRRLPGLTAQPVRGGASALVARAALDGLTRSGAVAGAEGSRLAERVAELVLTAVDHRVDLPLDRAATTRGGLDQAVLREVLDLIELRIDDPDLCPATIARACHLSLRSLHRLFADQPRSLARWIRYRRLERARAELVAHPERPIAVVAARFCFSEPSVFARAFRDEYGCSPRDFRCGTTGRTAGTQRTGGPARVA